MTSGRRASYRRPMEELERCRQQVIDCARKWRETPCSFPHDSDKFFEEDQCFYDNHLENCPSELARQDLVASLDKLDMVERR